MSALEKPQDSFEPEQEEASLTPSAPQQDPAPAPLPARVFEIRNPREEIRNNIADQRDRLVMLDQHDEAITAAIRLARKHLPVELLVDVDIQPQVTRRVWLRPVEISRQLRVLFSVREALGWGAVAEFLEATEALGFPLERWNSRDEPNRNCRQYDVKTPDDSFGLVVTCYLKEAASEADKVTCRRVLVGRKVHYGHPWEEDIYAFDCGQGAEATIRQALEEGKLK